MCVWMCVCAWVCINLKDSKNTEKFKNNVRNES